MKAHTEQEYEELKNRYNDAVDKNYLLRTSNTQLQRELEEARGRLCKVKMFADDYEVIAQVLDNAFTADRRTPRPFSGAREIQSVLRETLSSAPCSHAPIAEHINKCVMCQNQGTEKCSTLAAIKE